MKYQIGVDVRVLWVGYAFLWVGCAGSIENRVQQDFERAEEARAESVDTSEARLTDDGGLSLYVASALERSPRARAAFERWRAATLKISSARRLPEPTLQYAYFVRSVETRVGPQRHRFSLAQVLPWPTGLSASGAAMAHQARAAEREFDSAVLEIRHGVTEAYWTLWLIHETHRLKAEHDIVLETLAESLRARVASGQATLADLSQLELQIARHHDHTAEHHEMARTLTERLYAVAGIAKVPTHAPTRDVPTVGLPRESLDRLRTWASERPSVQRTKHLAASHQSRSAALSADRLPSFRFGVDYIETGEARTAGVVDSGKDALALSLGINLPIWLGTYGDAEDAAEAEQRAAEAETERGRFDAYAEVAAALSAVRDSYRRISLYRDTLLPQSMSVYESVMGSYQSGRSTIASVLMAQRDLLELTLEHAKARSVHARSWALLERVVGRGLQKRTMPVATEAPGAHEHTAHETTDDSIASPSGAEHKPASQASGASQPARSAVVWTCSMHPSVQEKKAGTCPICGMKLVRKKSAKRGTK